MWVIPVSDTIEMLEKNIIYTCRTKFSPAIMESHQELDSVVSMIMVNLPFPPMPVLVRRGDGEDSFCSSHDLLSSAISCSLIQCWSEMDGISVENSHHKAKERQSDQKMQVLIDLNHHNATLHNDEKPYPSIDSIYTLYADHYRKYMACYPGSSDIRILPIETVDMASLIHSQAMQHIKAKRINTNDQRNVLEMTYENLLKTYSNDLLLEKEN